MYNLFYVIVWAQEDFFYIFERRLWSTILHLFHSKYSNNNNIKQFYKKFK